MRWTCRSVPRFFGLSPERKEYVLEEVYQLVENASLTMVEAWFMPIDVRHWWIDRKSKDNEAANRQGKHLGPGA